jgi:hypothetical protein
MRAVAVRTLRALVPAVIAIAALVIVRQIGWLGGWAGYAAAVIPALLAPWSRNLSRRLLISGSLTIAWVPLAWWIGFGRGFDRAGWIIALAYGSLVFWVSWGPKFGRRLRTLVPTLRPSDFPPLTVAALSFWLFSPLIFSNSTNKSLSLLFKSGWDHVSHLWMVNLIAEKGSVLATTASAPDGSQWVASTYPKHFHALVNAVVEFGSPPTDSVQAISAAQYGQGLCLIFVVTTTLIAAGLAQSPFLRSRPRLAWPLVGLGTTPFLIGPGSTAVSAGYPNFIFACATVGLIACVAVGMPRMIQPLQVAVIVGLIVATANSWLLLTPLAVAAGAVCLLPLSRKRWRNTTTTLALCGVIVAMGIAGVAVAFVIALPSLTGASLAAGAPEPFPSSLIVAVISLTLALGIVLWLSRTPARSSDTRLRISALSAVTVVSALMLAVLGARQITTAHALLYYFGKLATGSVLILLVVLCLMISAFPNWQISTLGRRRSIATIASALITVAAIQSFGYVGPTFGSAIPMPADGLHYWSDARTVLNSNTPEASRLEHAADVARGQPFGTTIYLAGMPGDPLLRLANQWHLSLAGQWSTRAENLGVYLDSKQVTNDASAGRFGDAASWLLNRNKRVRVVVAPLLFDEIVPSLDPAVRSRLLTW